MRKLILTTAFAAMTLAGVAQTSSSAGSWHVTAALGLLNGNTLTGALVTGKLERVWRQRWTIGLGSGFDYYYFRSVPVFTEIQRYLGREDKGIFLYGGAGINLPWPTEDQRLVNQGWGWGFQQSSSDFDPGLYTDIGIGYGFKGKKGHGLFLRAGHSLKTMSQQYTERIWNGTTTVSGERDIAYQFGRVNIQLGFRF